MSRLILLDAGPLSLATHSKDRADAAACKAWLRSMLGIGCRVMVPEGADYEVRRELIRSGRTASVKRLDALAERIGHLPITTDVWLRAADLWAEARKQGKPTAEPAALDFDVLLAAQAQLSVEGGDVVTVATTNVGHLGRFIDARPWDTITE